MRTYILFAGSTYYPSGGWNDFHGLFNSVEAAVEHVANTNCDWWHVADALEQRIVKEGKRAP